MFSLSYPVKIFATDGSDGLGREICQELQTRLPRQMQPETGLKLGQVVMEEFSNENLQATVENVRGHFVVIIHTQVPPVCKHLVQLFTLLDAVENAKPADMLLVFPYMVFSRSDRKNKPRISTMGHRLARIICRSYRVNRFLLLDPHDEHIKHYFNPVADEISATYLLVDYLENVFFRTHTKSEYKVVFADSGAVERFKHVAYMLGLHSAYIDKDRPDDTEQTNPQKIVGDVSGWNCLLIDDEILTGGTTIGDAKILLDAGAKSVASVVVHPVVANKKMTIEQTVARLEQSPIEQFVVTNSIPVGHKLAAGSKFHVLSVAPLLAEAISRIVQNESLTDLRDPKFVRLYRPND